MDSRINEHLLLSDALASARHIAAFCAFDGEPDIAPALLAMHRRGQQICLPVVERTERTMQMHGWSPGSELQPGELGIMQPDATRIVAPVELDVILMPLVAWDRKGSRIGMGGGYYDQYLEPFAGSARPLRVGIGYAVQEVDRIPAELHDIDLHALVSENGWTDFTHR